MQKTPYPDAKILIVDDDRTAVRLLTKILTDDGYRDVHATGDPKAVRDLYDTIQPDLMILDLHMPHMEGFRIMEQLKASAAQDYLPILVISQERNRVIQFSALEAGAKDFLVKPFDSIEVLLRIRNFLEVRVLHQKARDQNKVLESKVQERTQALYQAQLDIVRRLGRAIEFRDSVTGAHTARMGQYVYYVSQAAGFNNDESEVISTASSLHDIGKIGIPDRILLKPGPLDPDERKIIETHTTIGGDLLSGSDSKFLQMAREIALTHHERWDGTGYPQRLRAEQIPILGRICGLCDVFDTLVSKRPYKEAWPLNLALEEIRKASGSHFDPQVVRCFFQVLPEIRRIYEASPHA